MKSLFLFFIIHFTFFCSAQNQPEKNSPVEMSRFQIGYTFSPDLCSWILVNTDDSDQSNETIELFNKNNVPKFGYTTGLNLFFNLNTRFTFETGLHYSDKGFRSKKMNISEPNPGPTDAIALKQVQTFRYFEFPSQISYNIRLKNLHCFISTGLVINLLFLTATTQTVYYNDGSKLRSYGSPNDNFTTLNISPVLGFGIDLFISKKMKFRIEPIFRYGAIPVSKMAGVNTFLWNSGIGFTYCIGV